jgi:two-component sensor histidine kinase
VSPLLLVLVLVSLVAVWLGIILGGLFERRNIQRQAEDDLVRMSQIVAEQTGNLLEEVRIYLGILDTWIQDHPDADPRTDPRFDRIVNNMRKDARIPIDFRLVSEDFGLYYIGTADATKRLAEVGDREYALVQADPSTRGLHVAAPVKSRVTGLWGIPVSYPLTRHAAGMATIFAAVELRYLNDLYETVRPKPDGSITLMRADGVLLCRAPFDEADMGRELWATGTWDKAKDGVTVMTSPFDGVRRIFAFRSVANYPLVVSVAAGENVTFTLWKRAMLVRVSALLLISSLLVALGLRLMHEWLALSLSSDRESSLNAELGERMELIRRQLEEKELLVRETNHRVKNHMAQLVSLIELAGPPDAAFVLEDLKARISGYCVLYDKLSYNADASGQLDLADYLGDLFELVVGLSSGSRNVEHSFSGGRIMASPRACSTMGLILGELVTNSIKYSRTGDAPLRIAVSLAPAGPMPGSESGATGDKARNASVPVRQPPVNAVLVYEDNGEGFDFEKVRSAPKDEHIGMILIDTMLSQYGGTIGYSGEKGSRFEIRM